MSYNKTIYFYSFPVKHHPVKNLRPGIDIKDEIAIMVENTEYRKKGNQKKIWLDVSPGKRLFKNKSFRGPIIFEVFLQKNHFPIFLLT